MRRERSERSVRTQITSFSQLLPNPTIRQPPTASLPKETQRPRCVKHDAARRRNSLDRHLLQYVTGRAKASIIMKLRRFTKRLRYRCGRCFANFNRSHPTRRDRTSLRPRAKPAPSMETRLPAASLPNCDAHLPRCQGVRRSATDKQSLLWPRLSRRANY
jgi:hypothetical protein